jgi:hypothetical protein
MQHSAKQHRASPPPPPRGARRAPTGAKSEGSPTTMRLLCRPLHRVGRTRSRRNTSTRRNRRDARATRCTYAARPTRFRRFPRPSITTHLTYAPTSIPATFMQRMQMGLDALSQQHRRRDTLCTSQQSRYDRRRRRNSFLAAGTSRSRHSARSRRRSRSDTRLPRLLRSHSHMHSRAEHDRASPFSHPEGATARLT